MHMEVRALFGRFVWSGVNIDDVTIHPSWGSRIKPTLKQNSTSGKFCFLWTTVNWWVPSAIMLWLTMSNKICIQS